MKIYSGRKRKPWLAYIKIVDEWRTIGMIPSKPMKGGYNRKRNHLFNRTPEGAMEKQDRRWMRRHHIPQPEFYNICTGTWHYPIVCSGCGRRVGFGSKDKPVKGCFIDGLRICPDCHPEFYSEAAKAERRRKSEEIKLKVMKEFKDGSNR